MTEKQIAGYKPEDEMFMKEQEQEQEKAKSSLSNLSREKLPRNGHDKAGDIVVSDYDMRFLNFHNPYHIAQTVVINNRMAFNTLQAHVMIAEQQAEMAKKQQLRQQIVRPFGN